MRMNITKFQAVFANRSAIVDVLAIFFGVGTWIGINSLWIQLPLLVNVLPESWYLASYLVIIIQIANVAPLLYTLIQKFCPIPDRFYIYLLLIIGVIAGVLMSLYYDITAVVLGAERSVVFFAIVFGFALVGCTSSVLFMPYFGRFRDIYLVTYLIGEGLSGLLPGILGLIQGVGGNAQCVRNNSTEPDEREYIEYYPSPRFSTQTFFIIISSLSVAALIAFILLDQLKSVRNEYASSVTIAHGNKYHYNHDNQSETESGEKTSDDNIPEKAISASEIRAKKLSVLNYRGLLVLLGTVCMFVNAIFPSVMPFGK